ncbi:MAG: hypothetical protein K2N80_13865 [Lachnospiraceae bacterium]|nr:hypothetical protein [Lachnospiraceae bacterium]
MKNKCKFLFALMFLSVFLLYKVDSAAAMANVQPDTSDVRTDTDVEAEQSEESASEAEQSEETISEPEEPEETVSEPDFVTTGTELLEWLELHKNIGGAVRLTDNVVLEGYYSFCPSGINMPPVFVDTDKYTITVTGEIDLLSDDHLIFSGKPDEKGIFCVADKGMLSMQGVVVESGQCALWQEEGAGLVVSGGHVTGSIHYADTPFVMYENHICIIVEKGQMLNDVLPSQISCTVNRQGQVSHNELVPLSWSLEGTEMQQEERMRFQVRGSFLYASSKEPALCTVAYNDHPLTFTDVRVSVCGSLYTFQGWYTKPEEHLPITVMTEYSFDGERWFLFEEETVTDTSDTFFIAVKSEQYDAVTYSNIYIRLQWNDNGTSYFSNVLCYAADNLEYVADIGGSRGGGTSITNPPDKPQESIDDAPLEDEGPVPGADGNTNLDKAESKVPSDMNPTKNGDDDIGSDAAGDGQSSNTEAANANEGESFFSESANTNEGMSSHSESANTNEGMSSHSESTHTSEGGAFYSEPPGAREEQSFYAESKAVNAGQSSYLEAENDVGNINDADNKEDIDPDNSGTSKKEQMRGQPLRSDVQKNNYIVPATGFVLLSVFAGIVGFCVHSRSGTNK